MMIQQYQHVNIVQVLSFRSHHQWGCLHLSIKAKLCFWSFSFIALICPDDIIVTTNRESEPVSWIPPNPQSLLFVSSSRNPGDTFRLGENTVTYSFFDTDVLSLVMCNFTVTITGIVCQSGDTHLTLFEQPPQNSSLVYLNVSKDLVNSTNLHKTGSIKSYAIHLKEWNS